MRIESEQSKIDYLYLIQLIQYHVNSPRPTTEVNSFISLSRKIVNFAESVKAL